MKILRQPKLLADDFAFLEAPCWHDGRLWVSDVFDHRIYAVAPDGRREVICEADRPSGLGFLPDGTLVFVDAVERKLLRLSGGALREYADLSRHAVGYLNDFAMDKSGRIYVGNFGYDYDGGESPKPTSLYRVDPDRTITEVGDGVEFPNGSKIVNNGRTLVVAETWARRITAFDLASNGTLSNRRLFADLGHREPDGLCADAEGALWVGCFNTREFVRVTDGGRITHSVPYNGSGISCALGGDDGYRLFMTVVLDSTDDIGGGKRKSAIFYMDVDVPAASG